MRGSDVSPRGRSEEADGDGVTQFAGSFFGLPPLAPFARAAAALAAERTLPPLRPRATAAGFLRGTAENQKIRQRLMGDE